MAKYLYLFRGGHAQDGEFTPEQAQATMEKWQKWMGQLAAQSILVDGLPLASEGKCLEGPSAVLTDGPYAEGKELVGGYLIVNAESLDAATEHAKGCPILADNGHVEVREMLSM